MKHEDHYLVPLEKLKKVWNYEDELEFCKTSFDVPLLDAIVDQERALTAMEFGLAMDVDGYNIFVVGLAGTGKNEYTREVVSRAAAGRQIPNDWCYIHNFSNNDKPMAVSLPAGQGCEFQKDMEKLITELRTTIRKAFEGTDYELKKDRIFNVYQTKMEKLVQIIGQKALDEGFGVQPVGMKFVFIRLREGRPFQPEDYSNMTDEERHRINEKRYGLVKNLDKILIEGQLSEKMMTVQIYELTRDTAYLAAEPLIQQLKDKYRDIPNIIEYLD